MPSFVQYVGVKHGRANVFVTEKFLDRPDVITTFKQVRDERMAKCVTRGAFRKARGRYRLSISRMKLRLAHEPVEPPKGIMLFSSITNIIPS